MATWREAKKANPKIAERQVRDALESFDQLWAELFPAEQARIVQLLVERVEISEHGAKVVLKVEGLTRLLAELQPASTMSVAA